MAKISQLPEATVVNDKDIVPIVQDGETKQIPRGLLVPKPPDDLQVTGNLLQLTANGEAVGQGEELPKTPVDALLSDTSENPVQGKAIKAYIDGKFTAPELLDTFTVPEGGDPVLSFSRNLTGQGWQRIWLSGAIYSSDVTAAQTFHLRTSAGSEIFRLAYKHWNLGKVYVSAEMRRMPNGLIIGEIALSAYQYTNENGMGDAQKSVGRFNTQQIAGVHISLDNQTQMFAAGTRIEVWGLEK